LNLQVQDAGSTAQAGGFILSATFWSHFLFACRLAIKYTACRCSVNLKKGLHFCRPFVYLVGRHGLEPWTKGLLGPAKSY
jgi:hypothetical protein